MVCVYAYWPVFCLVLGTVGIAVGQCLTLGDQPDNLFIVLHSAGIFSLAMNNSYLEKTGKASLLFKFQRLHSAYI